MKKFKDVIVSIIIYIAGSITFGIGSIFLILISLVTKGNFFDWYIKFLCKAVMFCTRTRITLEGRENFDANKQYIVMLNHINIFDGFLFTSTFPGKARAMEEESHFDWPLYGWVLKRMGMIPVNRKSGRKALIALKKAGELIRTRKNFSVCILPEGTRTLTGLMGEFKKGGFLIALEAGLDILPVVQIGTYQVKQKGHWLIRPQKVRLVIEEPVPTSDYTRKNINDLMTLTRSRFEKHVD